MHVRNRTCMDQGRHCQGQRPWPKPRKAMNKANKANIFEQIPGLSFFVELITLSAPSLAPGMRLCPSELPKLPLQLLQSTAHSCHKSRGLQARASFCFESGVARRSEHKCSACRSCRCVCVCVQSCGPLAFLCETAVGCPLSFPHSVICLALLCVLCSIANLARTHPQCPRAACRTDQASRTA